MNTPESVSSKRIDNRVRMHTLIGATVIVNPVTGTYEIRLDEASVREAVAEAMRDAQAQAELVSLHTR